MMDKQVNEMQAAEILSARRVNNELWIVDHEA